jgi:hypothetical protein
MRGFVVAAAVVGWLTVGCTTSPTCPAGDVGCLVSGLSVSALNGETIGARLPLTRVDADRLSVNAGAPDGGVRLLSSATLELDPHGEALVVLFEDPFGCQPAYCFSACPRGFRCDSAARCIPAVKDGLTRGITTHWLELGSQPEQTTELDLIVTPVVAPGCAEDSAERLQNGDASVRVGVPAVIGVSALRRLKPTVPDAGACLRASTSVCTGQGISGSRSRCITRTEYEGATGLPLPDQPAPDGTFGCFDEQSQTLVKPCMANSTCRVGFRCGGGSVVGGVCNP